MALPAPCGPTPSERQRRWHELRFYGFLHFTVNTFTERVFGRSSWAEIPVNRKGRP